MLDLAADAGRRPRVPRRSGRRGVHLTARTDVAARPRGAVLDPRRAVRHLGRGGGAAAPGCVRRRGRGQARRHVHPLRPGPAALAVATESEIRSRELELLAGIASQARLAITNAGSFATLERTFLSTVEALANALEAKDSYTSSHARWICDMSIEVGRELGLDAVHLKRVELGALFHDIGKIGIPASILMKPGPLTTEERSMIERHLELGERILAPIDQLAQVRPIVRACHERYDGLGYLDSLKGEEIPLEARIIFACDAFHAMTTDRPYREALPVEEAFRRLVDAAGTQFDPRVVDVRLRVLKQPPPAED